MSVRDPEAAADTTMDAFLGGRVTAIQPASGHHRAGLEAVLLGASIDSGYSGKIVDLGAGAGVAGFCAAARCPGLEVLLVERESALLDCVQAALGLQANEAFASRIRIAHLDIEAPEDVRSAAGLGRETAQLVLTNPPFHDAASVRRSPSDARAGAHVLAGDLDAWFRVAAYALQPGGAIVAVTLASALPEVTAALGGRFGAASILPLHPRHGRPAERLLVRAVKGSRARPQLLPGLVLHRDSGNAFTDEMNGLLRSGCGLAEIHPSWGPDGK